MLFLNQLETHHLKVFSSWFTNLSAGFLGSIFFLFNQPLLLTFSVLLSISFIIEKYLTNL